MIDIVATYIYFFAVIDPVGTVPVFMEATKGYDDREKRKVAFIATAVSAAVLVFFVMGGELILNAMSIPLSAFQVAGGLVLFVFALSMIFGESKPEEEVRLAKDSSETAIFPVAMPSIAGPGSMLTAVLLTERAHYGFSQQLQITAVMLAVVLTSLIFMLLAGRIHQIIGQGGASVVSRVMGLILASAAVSNVLSGIVKYFGL